jgi:hypothetical protein
MGDSPLAGPVRAREGILMTTVEADDVVRHASHQALAVGQGFAPPTGVPVS